MSTKSKESKWNSGVDKTDNETEQEELHVFADFDLLDA